MLKGRQNYLCPNRLDRALQLQNDLFTSSEQQELLRIKDWSQKTTEGTLSDIDVEPDSSVWAQVCSEPHICTPKTCGTGSRCFYQEARKKLLTADLIVVNHTLFFLALESMGEPRAGPQVTCFRMILLSWTKRTPSNLSQRDRLASESRNTASNRRSTGSTIQSRKRVCSPFCELRKRSGRPPNQFEVVDRFFQTVEQAADFRKGRECRVRKPGLVPDSVTIALARVQAAVVTAVKEVDDEKLKSELQDLGRRIREARRGVVEFLQQTPENHVYWVERTGKTAQNLTLNAAPVDISSVLNRMLFPEDRICVMTSATLSVGRDDLAYFRNRIGASTSMLCRSAAHLTMKSRCVFTWSKKCRTHAILTTRKRSKSGLPTF